MTLWFEGVVMPVFALYDRARGISSLQTLRDIAQYFGLIKGFLLSYSDVHQKWLP